MAIGVALGEQGSQDKPLLDEGNFPKCMDLRKVV